MFYMLRFPWPEDNPLLYSQEVWFTKSVASTVISSIMDRQIEPWQHDLKNTGGRFELETVTPRLHSNHFGHDIDLNHATVEDKACDYHKRFFSWDLTSIPRETEMRAMIILT